MALVLLDVVVVVVEVVGATAVEPAKSGLNGFDMFFQMIIPHLDLKSCCNDWLAAEIE